MFPSLVSSCSRLRKLGPAASSPPILTTPSRCTLTALGRVKPLALALAILGVVMLASALLSRFHRSRNLAALDAYRAGLHARGERLTPGELGYPPSPEPGRSIDRLLEAAQLLVTRPTHLDRLALMRPVGPGQAEPAWAATRGPGNTEDAASSYTFPWPTFTAQFESQAATLQEMREATRVLPHGLVADLTNSSPLGLPVVLKTTWWLVGDGLAALHSGELQRAQGNIEALARLAQYSQKDYPIVCQMFRAIFSEQALVLTWEALQAPGWSETHLASLQDHWEAVNFADSAERGVIGSRAEAIVWMDHMRRFNIRERLRHLGSLPPPAGPSVDQILEQVLVNAFWPQNFEADQLLVLQHHQKALDAIRSVDAGRPLRDIEATLQQEETRLEAKTSTLLGRYRHYGSRTSISRISMLAAKSLRRETERRLTVAALALERFRLRHGKSPATLTELVPQFLPAVPPDPLGSRELCYRRGVDGTFLLYPVGEDARVDGGNAANPSGGADTGLWAGKDAVWPRTVGHPWAGAGLESRGSGRP